MPLHRTSSTRQLNDYTHNVPPLERLCKSDYAQALSTFFSFLVQKHPAVKQILQLKRDSLEFYVAMDAALGIDETWLATKLLMNAHGKAHSK